MRFALGAFALLMLSGCQQISALVSPMQTLQLANQTTVPVVVRVGAFTAGSPLVQDADALQRATLTPGGSTSFKLAVGHYQLYAEAVTPTAENAITDVKLSSAKSLTLTVQEQLEDRVGDNKGPGYRTRQLGWTSQ